MMEFLRKSLIVFTSAIVALLLCNSVDVSAKVPSNPPPVCEHFPTRVIFSNIRANSVNVSWLDLGAGYQYQVGWRMKNTNSWIISPVIASPNAQYVINNLTKDREYEVQVRAKCQNEASFSNFAPVSLGFRTLNTPFDLCTARVPSPPLEVKISSLGSDQSVIRWKNIPDASGTVVVYGLVSESPSKWKEIILCKNIDSLVIKNLNPNQNYRVRVRTLCNQCSTQNGNAKKSGWTNILDFRTLTGNAGTQVVGGMVYNEKLQPIKGAKVTVNGQSTTTDARGRYFTRLVWKERSLVKAEHPDYNTRTVGFFPTNGDTVFCSVLMEQFTVTHTFNGKDAMLLGNTAFTVQLPENAIMDEATRQPYTGMVKACIKSAQPGDPLFGERMPGGDFLALDAQNREVVLYSYGFFGCELRGENNQKLNLAPGKKAQVAFKITSERLPNSQPTMPLWHFDESNAIWKEEGSTRKEGETYIGEVSHFSSWNCDWRGPLAWVEGTLLDCEGKKAVGGIVYTDYSGVEADNNGFYRRWVPAGLLDKINISTGDVVQHQVKEKLTEGTTYQVPPILNYAPIKATGFVIDDKAEIYAFISNYQDSDKTLEFSMNGITWQNNKVFVGLPYRDIYDFWVRVIGTNCPTSFKIKRIESVHQDCGLLPEPNFLEKIAYSTYDYVRSLSTPAPYHGLFVSDSSYSDFVNNLGVMGCLNVIQFATSRDINRLSVDIELISRLKYLQNISLVYCSVRNSHFLGKFSNAQYLSFYFCNLTSLPSEIGNLSQLKRLELSSNQLTALPNSIGKLTKLTQLILERNAITEIPSSISNLTELTQLDLTNNALTNLPEEIGQLANLEEIYVGGNPSLTQLPPQIFNLRKLKKLYLGGIGVSSLPPEIANLKDNLRELELRGCPISPTEQAKIRAWLPNTTIIF